MLFKKAREESHHIRCCGCGKIKFKDDCWTCEVCEKSSCDRCGEVTHGFTATLCTGCKDDSDCHEEAMRDAYNYSYSESYKSMKEHWE